MTALVQWEYHIEKFNKWSGIKPEEVEAALNAMGVDGWEIVSTTSLPDGALWVTAKRILTHSAARARKSITESD